MEANDYRLNNFIQDLSNNVLIINGLHENAIYSIYPEGVAENMDTNPKNIKPIPLTEEWLFKFGFQIDELERDEYYIYEADHLVCLYKGINGGYQRTINDYDDGIELNNVHQLQNLYFALTGEELKQK
jgi:hypothetical protein